MATKTDVIPQLKAALSGQSWAYPAVETGRDERIDFLRGLAMLSVLVNHIAISSYYHIFSTEAISVTTGAEGFVLLSGLMIGLIYGRQLLTKGWAPVAKRLFRRAFQLYVLTVVVITLIYLISLLPFIDSIVLTKFTDPDTGAIEWLYGQNSSLKDLVVNILLLIYGPGQYNVLGVYVVLVALAPFLLWLLKRTGPWPLLILSWAVYLIQAGTPYRTLPFQSEDSFPLLIWQLLFVHGMLAGYYYRRIDALFRGKYGPLVFALVGLICIGFFCFASAKALGRIGFHQFDNEYRTIYISYFQRTNLGLGRFINELAILLLFFGLLTYCWVPLRQLFGWLLVPIGAATLYVFTIHLAFVLVVANIPILQAGHVWLNTIAHTLVILCVWLMVKRQVLFGIIPR